MDTMQKLKILADSAKYDASCSSSGSSRKNTPGGIGNAAPMGVCHSFSGDGRCVSLLKLLLSNCCIYDCQYCINRTSNDVPRASFTPREVADLTINFYKRNYIEGLFLSSAVIKSPDYTMEKIIECDIGDIEKWMNDAEERTGSRPTRAICTSTTFNYLVKNEGIIAAIKGVNSGVAITKAKVKKFVEEELNLVIEIYSKKFKSEAGVTTNYFKDNVFTLLPDGDLGNTWLGTTPEESDLMSGATDAEVMLVKQGIAITTTKKTDPVNVNTKVSMIGLPSFERADEIVIATVNPS